MGKNNTLHSFAPRKDDIVRSEKEALEDLASYETSQSVSSSEIKENLEETVLQGDSLAESEITEDVVVDSTDMLIIASGNGLWCYDPTTNFVQSFYESKSRRVTSVAIHEDELWFVEQNAKGKSYVCEFKRSGLYGGLVINHLTRRKPIDALTVNDGGVYFGGQFTSMSFKPKFLLQNYASDHMKHRTVLEEKNALVALFANDDEVFYVTKPVQGVSRIEHIDCSKNTVGTICNAGTVFDLTRYATALVFAESSDVNHKLMKRDALIGGNSYEIASENNIIRAVCVHGSNIIYGGDFSVETPKATYYNSLNIINPVTKAKGILHRSFDKPIMSIASGKRSEFEYLKGVDKLVK